MVKGIFPKCQNSFFLCPIRLQISLRNSLVSSPLPKVFSVKNLNNYNYEVIEILPKITCLFLKTFSISIPVIEKRLEETLPYLVSKPHRMNVMSVGEILNLSKSSSNST
jgi:hypothetical protein